MKNNKKILLIIFAILLLCGVLFAVNRDLFSFTYDTRCERTFFPDLDERQDYIVNGPVLLKPGAYLLSLQLSAEGNGNGIFLFDGDDNEIFYADLPDGTQDPDFPFEISGNAKQVRIGVRYLKENTNIRIRRIRITSDHVLYRESVLRHLTVSVLIILLAGWILLRLCFPDVLWRWFPLLKIKNNELTLFLLIGLTAASCYPLFNGKTYIHGEDMFFHITRIRGLADSLQAGYFPVRDQLYWLNNYGYGVGFYYPDVFLYFPAVLVLLGFDLLTSYKIFLILFTFLSIASVWFACQRISNNRTAAVSAAVFMAFAAYRLSNVYYRGAVGETQAAVFYPLIILGLYEIFCKDRGNWLCFAVGFLGLAFCHVISLTIAFVFTAVFLVIHIGIILKNKAVFRALLKSVILVVCASAFFWLPMLEQSFTNPNLRINNVLSGETGMNKLNYAFPVSNLFSFFKTWDFAYQAECIYPGWSLLIVPLLAVPAQTKGRKKVYAANCLLLTALILVWMCTRAFPWHWKVFLPFVTRIQFAYRILLPASVLLCLCGGMYFAYVFEGGRQALCLGFLVLFCFFATAFPVLQESIENRSVEKRMFVMQDNRVSGEEYLPHGLHKDFPGKNADTVRLAGQNIPFTIKAHKRQKLGFRFTYEVPEGSGEVRFSVPLIYYTGFRGTLTKDDGTVLKPEIGWDDMGLVSLSNQGVTSGKVEVYYEKTSLQIIGECITVLTLILSGSLLFFRRSQKNLFSLTQTGWFI